MATSKKEPKSKTGKSQLSAGREKAAHNLTTPPVMRSTDSLFQQRKGNRKSFGKKTANAALKIASEMRPGQVLNRSGKFLLWINKQKNEFLRIIRRKRQERLTLMYIPHNELSIRNFHISNLTLTILLSVFSIVILVSAILVIRHNSTVQEVDKLRISQKEAEIQFAKVREEIMQLSKSYEEIRQSLSSLYSISEGKREDKSLFAQGGVEAEFQKMAEDYQKGGKDAETIPLEIFIMNRILNDMEVSRKPLDSIQEFLKKRDKVIKNTPTIWPSRGYMINPFGFIRFSHRLQAGYNNGVDISAPPGSPVSATAPGVVVSVQKDANSMYSVRIRHNYGYETLYQGLELVTISLDEKVTKGENIGTLGHPEDTLESILHYEVRIGVEPVNPLPYLSLAGGG